MIDVLRDDPTTDEPAQRLLPFRRRTPYPSDLTDEQWRSIAPLLPREKHLGRNRSTDLRDVVNAINYRWSTGCVWRMLPHDFPHWATVYTYFRAWERAGVLSIIRDVLLHRRRPRRRPRRQQTLFTSTPLRAPSPENTPSTDCVA